MALRIYRGNVSHLPWCLPGVYLVCSQCLPRLPSRHYHGTLMAPHVMSSRVCAGRTHRTLIAPRLIDDNT
eukprot:4331075-Alexandrium_andersonii.AAC.1